MPNRVDRSREALLDVLSVHPRDRERWELILSRLAQEEPLVTDWLIAIKSRDLNVCMFAKTPLGRMTERVRLPDTDVAAS